MYTLETEGRLYQLGLRHRCVLLRDGRIQCHMPFSSRNVLSGLRPDASSAFRIKVVCPCLLSPTPSFPLFALLASTFANSTVLIREYSLYRSNPPILYLPLCLSFDRHQADRSTLPPCLTCPVRPAIMGSNAEAGPSHEGEDASASLAVARHRQFINYPVPLQG